MVRVGFPGGPRLEWYDRNPQFSYLHYRGDGLAPHALVSRGSYTAPTGKKAMVTTHIIFVQRVTAAGPAGLSRAYSGSANAVLAEARIRTNNVGDKDSHFAMGLFWLGASVAFSFVTEDTSTGGTVDYLLSAHIVEFDA